jgi:pyroglutamyl-peptidase
MAASARILVTGFGPFPGVPLNISGTLALRLACERFGDLIEAHVLRTEWAEVARLGPALLEAARPRLVIHFGVSRRARGFRIERRADNIAKSSLDAAGALPPSAMIVEAGPAVLVTSAPASRLAKYLRQQGLPATVSSSCGGYLCNFLYFLSLDWAARQASPCDVCFAHVPAASGHGGSLSEHELLRGAELLMSYLLAHTEKRDRGGKEQAIRTPAPAVVG